MSRERAFIWSDSEFYSRGAVSGYRTKLTANFGAQLVVACSGWVDIHLEAQRIALAALSYDELVDKLPDKLRTSSVKCEPSYRSNSDCAFGSNHVLAVGWSRRDARMMCFRFSGYSFFQTEFAAEHISPSVDFEGFRPSYTTDILPIAQLQMARIREHYPDATGGVLSVIEMRREFLAGSAFHDFAPARGVADAEVAGDDPPGGGGAPWAAPADGATMSDVGWVFA